MAVIVVCDTAKVRVFKQITTCRTKTIFNMSCLRYCKSTSFQANHNSTLRNGRYIMLFAILQKYEFSSKSQPMLLNAAWRTCCLRYCKSTSFQANHNFCHFSVFFNMLLAILQKYEFSSKSQQFRKGCQTNFCCLRYCKSTSFQANHNEETKNRNTEQVVCDTAKVRVFKQITTVDCRLTQSLSCLRYCKSTSFQANHNIIEYKSGNHLLFAILQKYEFSSKSQHVR